MTTTIAPARLAAPATESDEIDECSPSDRTSDDHLDDLCERLAHWSRTRRLFGTPKLPPSILGQLGKRTRPMREPPDADCAPQLAALWVAVQTVPADRLDRVVFELHYFQRITNKKLAAAALGIGRQRWYTLLRDFRREVYIVSKAIQHANEVAATQLPNWRA